MDRDLTRDEIVEQWEALHQKLTDLGEVIAEALEPAFRRVIGAACSFMIQLRRVQLYANLLTRWPWIPERLAHWLSAKWPERWLPELRFEAEGENK